MNAEEVKKKELEVEDGIRAAAELIFDFLYREGQQELERLREKVSHKVPFFDWGLGWLVGEGDIAIARHEDTFIVRRTDTDPAVIPVWGN